MSPHLSNLTHNILRIQYYSPFITQFITSNELVEDKKHKCKQAKRQWEAKQLNIYIYFSDFHYKWMRTQSATNKSYLELRLQICDAGLDIL